MSKTIGLKQLAQKTYTHAEGIPEEFMRSMGGKIEDAFDCVIWGQSGHGKSNFTAMFIKAFMKALKCKCEYVAYEEGHGFTIQETLIRRHNMLEEVGNNLLITDFLTFDELYARMAKRKSAKIWVIDSIQDAMLTKQQCAVLKRDFVLSKKKKIIIYVSWCQGREPAGDAAYSVKYRANMKLFVEGHVVFPRSRFGGNKPFVIWEGDKTSGAKGYWKDEYTNIKNGIVGGKKQKKETKEKKPKEPAKEPVTHMQVLPEAPKPVFKEGIKDAV